ncbi:MAG: leucine-rich repeat domain-containing protein [Clostridia bacterium]|nr:leucine-rich repeat domain-containing protein [Clostridia bacterium]
MKKRFIAVLLTAVVGCTSSAFAGCTVGNDNDGTKPEHTHSFTNYVSNNDANCYTQGTKTAQCDYCYVKDTIPDETTVGGHVFSDGVCVKCHNPLLEYTLGEDGESYSVNITKTGICFEKEITVPAEYNGKPVTTIPEHGFSSLFHTEKITLPEGLTTINDYAFAYSKVLKEVSIPDSVEKIGFDAFGGCESLQSFTFPRNLTEIETSLFNDCKSLTAVNIPEWITRINLNAFNGLSSLEEITVSADNTAYKSVDNCLLTKDGKTMLLGCKNSRIPDGVEVIEDAFYGCVSLKQITLPQSLVELGGFTFYGCEALESIVLPTNLKVIARHTFDGCTSLKQIHLPASLQEIEYRLFADCANLDKITVDPNNAKFRSIDNCLLSKDCKILYEGSNKSVIPHVVEVISDQAFAGRKGLQSITLPASIKQIGSGAFYGCEALTEVTLPDGLERLEGGIFTECPNLKYNVYGNMKYLGSATNPYFALISEEDRYATSYEIHQDTKIISGRAFEWCNKVESLTVPDGVIYIGLFSFSCDSLKEISLGKSLQYIDVFAFYDSPLTKFEFRGTEEEWNLIEKSHQWSDGMPQNLTITFKNN